MKIVIWDECDDQTQHKVLSRAPQTCSQATRDSVTSIIDQVAENGDAALLELTERFDGRILEKLGVGLEQLEQAAGKLPPSTKAAIDECYKNILSFHNASRPVNVQVETAPGVVCDARYIGIETVGLYVPGGKTPLPSSVLMMGVPARIAKCNYVVLCTPPNAFGDVDPGIAYAALLCNIRQLYLVGGAQAIAAMAFGTMTIPACNKIFGPGSIWVTEAKRQVASSMKNVSIDMPAGPSEVMVLADRSANPGFVAADLLAQAEHGSDSQAILVTDCERLAKHVVEEIERQVRQLDREKLIRQSLTHSSVVVVSDLKKGVDVANRYAAEHLILQTDEPEIVLKQIRAAGSVFLGQWTPEVLGDYCSGTNHVLPTSGWARSVNGLSTVDFMKRITVQSATQQGLVTLSDAATTLAEWEGLTAHAAAITIRLRALQRRNEA